MVPDLKTGQSSSSVVYRVKRIQYPARQRLMMQDCQWGLAQPIFLLFQVNGMNAKENQAFRSTLKKCHFHVKFVSASILKAALSQSQQAWMVPLLSLIGGPTLMAYSRTALLETALPLDDTITTALLPCLRGDSSHRALLIAAQYEATLFTPQGFEDLIHQAQTAGLSKSKLHGQLLASLQSSALAQLVCPLQSPIFDLVYTLHFLSTSPSQDSQ